MDAEKVKGLAEATLSAWNKQDVEGVVSCYTEDCVYLDPNTRGPVKVPEPAVPAVEDALVAA
jgi:ketosteroid isomerase-like protein